MTETVIGSLTGVTVSEGPSGDRVRLVLYGEHGIVGATIDSAEMAEALVGTTKRAEEVFADG